MTWIGWLTRTIWRIFMWKWRFDTHVRKNTFPVSSKSLKISPTLCHSKAEIRKISLCIWSISMKELTWLLFGVLTSLDRPHFGANWPFWAIWALLWPCLWLCSVKPFTRDLARRKPHREGGRRLGQQTQKNSWPEFFFFVVVVVFVCYIQRFSPDRCLLKKMECNLSVTLLFFPFVFIF